MLPPRYVPITDIFNLYTLGWPRNMIIEALFSFCLIIFRERDIYIGEGGGGVGGLKKEF